MIVDKLPKTRSGKILRTVLKGMVQGAEYKVPPTIEDESVLESIQKVVLARGFGKESKLKFEDEEAEKDKKHEAEA